MGLAADCQDHEALPTEIEVLDVKPGDLRAPPPEAIRRRIAAIADREI
jgi:hypothetical protein